MERRACWPVYLGTILCLSGAILLVCLPHLARCGAAHPVITSPKSSNQQANTLTQPQQASSNQMHQLGRSHQHSYSSVQTLSSSPSRLGPPNLPALPTQNSYAYEDQLANAQQQAPILIRSGQRLQPAIQAYKNYHTGTTLGPMSHSTNLVPSQQQFNNMLTNPYTNATHMLLLDLRQQLITRAIKFDEHFRDLLSKSKVGLHNMFMETYGMIYEHNTEIFTNMYEDLTQYYATGQIKLTESMNNFFISLYQKIFQVYNSNKAFSQSYLECATQQLVVLRPFKDAPEKLIDDIRHVFVAARTVNQALNAGIDLIKNIISLGSPPQCTSMTNDRLLRQGEGVKSPCLSFCSEVITRCIGRNNLDSLSGSWKNYVSLLADLSKMLSGRYNIANIITPIDVQISEAIMNFQDNANNISQSVFEACSKAASPASPAPMTLHNRISRRAPPAILPSSSGRRNANQQPASANEHQFGVGATPDRRHDSPVKSFTQSLGRTQPSSNRNSALGPAFLSGISDRPLAIIDEIRTYIQSSKNFWSNLPNAVCTSNQTLGPSAPNPTGPASRRNPPTNCLLEPLAIWEMNSDLRYTLEINQIIERFKTMDSKIRDALAGREIEWSSSHNQRPMNPDAPVTRPAVVTYPTSTTMSTIFDPEESMGGDEVEPGSGGSEEPEDPDEPEPDPETETETETENAEPDDPSAPDEQQPGPPEVSPEDGTQGNSIDAKPDDSISNKPNFITVDPSPRKSGAVSLVILENRLQPLLASLFSLCALLVVYDTISISAPRLNSKV